MRLSERASRARTGYPSWFDLNTKRRSMGSREDRRSCRLRREDRFMATLAEKLGAKLRSWRPETATEMRARVQEPINLADDDLLDLARWVSGTGSSGHNG